ncbi:hypothetical protein Pcinc_014362 [Petrolisthes cinctipes]|uniref:Uncharacterized protein n=1 Tax=Petrolisthes cinctipes TaxID=88211 RepID=A0AAE1G0G8_PETCI|nr:hypothetical protein Pcinc_014362 [Petrolisthes cinctipes]
MKGEELARMKGEGEEVKGDDYRSPDGGADERCVRAVRGDAGRGIEATRSGERLSGVERGTGEKVVVWLGAGKEVNWGVRKVEEVGDSNTNREEDILETTVRESGSEARLSVLTHAAPSHAPPALPRMNPLLDSFITSPQLTGSGREMYPII